MKVPRWEDAVKSVKKRLTSDRKEGEQKDALPDEPQDEALSAETLITAFSQAIEVMERENALLKEDNLTESVALLPEKTTVIDRLEQLIIAVHEAGCVPDGAAQPLKELQGRFDAVSEENRLALQRSLDTQGVVMKILVDSAIEETQHGYISNGKAGVDGSRSTFSLDSKA